MASTKPSASAKASAPRMRASSAPGAAMFWRIVPENRIVSWSTMPMRARSERGS
jgi:hypothetical protein